MSADIYNIDDYLTDSARTVAGAEPDYTRVGGQREVLSRALLNIASGGAGADLLKRGLYYGDPQLEKRSKEAFARIHQMAIKLGEGKGRELTAKEMEVFHAACGLASEAGEIMEELINASLEDRPLDVENLKEEAGDVMWYPALLIRWIGSTFVKIGYANIKKLFVRYPQNFDKGSAIERDLEAEKVALTG